MIVNAIYFKGDWAQKFEKLLTRDEPFYIDVGKERKVVSFF